MDLSKPSIARVMMATTIGSAILGAGLAAGPAAAGGQPHGGGGFNANAHVKGDSCIREGRNGGWIVDDSDPYKTRWVCDVDDRPIVNRGDACSYHGQKGVWTVEATKWDCVTIPK